MCVLLLAVVVGGLATWCLDFSNSVVVSEELGLAVRVACYSRKLDSDGTKEREKRIDEGGRNGEKEGK